ncbi:MAG: 2-hydroxymuconic semialdehyde dehydrogenase [Sphingobacteriales bacterium SCN 48-20]|uniref:aldehyde dehydrogenase n=1 Tax=Terrimonas ferruginea TaxID=249 RepID=UPI00086DEFF8|nr:aldehyde dehydrogenase [Terrimonas ferruginea]MBN8784812.1 aldehyde dehydrogenase [Terrimonas ferruginea]ODT94952.1 MAG: 2-hydroxymuconic semialdehyde dehydrogenase [Sphingobacteriales bacterium SCN 48-20]OJW45354.1 MAG: 2-hydroxymuconic semialdehyde dehydrogenase [Sphingobacteriales bacterium 48-107]
MTVPQQLSNYINGRLQAPLSGNYLEHINPATGEVAGHLPDSGHRDIQEAVNAAKAAFPAWSNTSPEERFTLLNRIADLITQYQEVLALAETNDNGKPITLSRTIDIPRAAANFRFFATAIMHFASEAHGMEDRGINYTLRQPVGVVGCISPWNLPLYLFTWKIAPALAAGNCVIAKPSEVTPVTSYLLSLICQEAGLPPGVLNIVHGTGPTAGEAIVTHPDVKAISFTGSTRAGERIASLAAPKFKKLSLELGGKNPALIFADCDWDKMMKETLRSAFANQGEICLCTSRILIEASIYDRFRNEFIEKASQMIPGDPLDDERRQGAVVSKAHQDKIQRCIDTAKQEGGRIACGGKSVQPVGRCANGYFVQPTIIEGLGPDSQTNQEEIFGPVVTLQAFHSEEEALQLANASTYGLAATIWTQDLSRAGRLAAKVEAGIIWVNCWLLRDLRTPFGGVKNSGVGREGGWEALRFFTEPRNVCISF